MEIKQVTSTLLQLLHVHNINTPLTFWWWFLVPLRSVWSLFYCNAACYIIHSACKHIPSIPEPPESTYFRNCISWTKWFLVPVEQKHLMFQHSCKGTWSLIYKTVCGSHIINVCKLKTFKIHTTKIFCFIKPHACAHNFPHIHHNQQSHILPTTLPKFTINSQSKGICKYVNTDIHINEFAHHWNFCLVDNEEKDDKNEGVVKRWSRENVGFGAPAINNKHQQCRSWKRSQLNKF